MGSGQVKNSSSIEQAANIMHKNTSRLMKWQQSLKFNWKERAHFTILPFKRMADWQIQLEGIQPTSPPKSSILTSAAYFQQLSSVDAYLSNLIGLKQICLVNLYDDFQLQIEKKPYSLTTTQQLTGVPKAINKNELRANISKFINILIYFSQIIVNLKNLYIIPQEIVELNNQYYLRGFYHKQCDKKKLIIAFIIWLCEECENFDDCYNFENSLGSISTTNRYIRQILFTIKSDKIDDQDMLGYFKNLNDKMRYLEGGFDSFHVCFRSKRQKYCTNNNKQWLLAKRNNEVFFYNIQDNHVCQGRIIRKSNKVNIENSHIIFNASQFEVSFMLQNSKNMVKTTQFQLSDCFTISDIEIKYKFPFKIKNAMLFCRGREVYLLDQMVYKYNIDENKIYQQSKKVNDYLCLTQSSEHNYIIIRYSIDIFRHGIKVYLDNRYDALMPSGNPDLASTMENIKVDIKHVQFCQQVYKGVYFMLASRNLWILDINYMCFFSFAPLQRLSHFYKGKAESKEYVFNIFSQPFKMNWLHHQHGHNIHIKEDIMHVLANVSGKIFYLQYRLIFEAGSLKLLSYKPLYDKKMPPKAMVITQAAHALPIQKQHYFNVYNESLQMYENTSWIHKGPVFFEVHNLRICSFKNYTQIFVITEGVLKPLRQMIEEQTKETKNLRLVQTVMLLYRIWNIMFYLNQNNISHKNFNLNNIWISQKKQVKLVGWSEPQRSWHISDYKDYLLTSFNLITLSNYDKLTQKFIQKHELQISAFPTLLQKMQASLRNKNAEKRPEVQKSLLSIKQSLNLEVYKILESHNSDNFIFSFENNTPRFTMLHIQECKIKKVKAVIQGLNESQEFTFKSSDQYAWNEQQGCLYIFTANYKMYEIKINTADLKQQTLFLEEYEYLPSNIIDCSFIFTANNLYAFGGVSRSCKSKVQYNESIYCFNRKKLTWEAIANLQMAKIRPKLVPSQSGNKIYVMAGDLGVGEEKLQILAFNTTNLKVERMVDQGMDNPFKALADRNIFKVFQISEQYSIYAIWSIGSMSFNLKIFSAHIAGFDIDIEGKLYLQEGVQLPSISIVFSNGNLHFLRPYGKYTKITFQGLQNPKIINRTLYSN